MLSGLIQYTLGFKNGPSLIMTAVGGTAGVFFVMAALASPPEAAWLAPL